MDEKVTSSTTPESEEEPQVFSVAIDGREARFDRRGFLGKAAATAAATVLASGCTPAAPISREAPEEAGEAEEAEPEETPTRKPTRTSSPEPTITDTPEPVGIESRITGDKVNFRAGPGTGYAAITQLRYGDPILLTGRLADSSWVAVALANPGEPGAVTNGWIKTTLVDTVGKDIESLPVIGDIPSTPTPLPGRYGSTSPGAKGIDYTFTDEYGKTYTMTLPCGSTLPDGAVCTCNCITVPGGCSCVEHTSCSCVEHTSTCTCDTVHYWYPN